jgi:hypothetical protein
MDVACRMNKGDRKCIQRLVGNSEGRRTLGKSMNIWKVNMKMGLEFVCSKKIQYEMD